MSDELAARLVAEIATDGPMPFDQFVERALYDGDYGFYTAHGQAGGRRGDFVTSVEVGPLFASVVADWLDAVWRQAGEPAEFLVTEAGAGVGTLFRGINRAGPACFESMTYTLVERSASMQVAHQSLPSRRWRSAAQLPEVRQHVILANELLDNLAFGVAERVEGGWAEVHVGADGGVLDFAVSAADSALAYLGDLAPDAQVGVRVPLATHAKAWVDSARANADRLLVFDYAATTAELAVRDQAGWLRTYAEHARGSNPLLVVGQRDITYDVPIDQLSAPTTQHLQMDWLHANGLPERLETARQTWAERAHIGDLAALAARSAIGEAKALTDPTGLGAFIALEWKSA